MTGALSHIRVLDLSRVLAAPLASQNLADFGAEVIKVERPGVGDDTRGWGPPYLKDRDGRDTTDALYFLCANRGKKSLTLDIATPAGQDIVRRLAACSDIVLENYKTGALTRYGLDYASLRAVNPRLIYCSVTGFGQTGPYAARPGYDPVMQAMGGLMSVTGAPDEAPGGGPLRAGVAVTDLMTAAYATIAMLAALAHRDVSGVGQHIDLALLEVQIFNLANVGINYLHTGKLPGRHGNAHPTVEPSRAVRCKDGLMMVACGNDGQFERLCAALERPELARDPRFANNPGRAANKDVLIPLIEDITRQRTAAEWVARLEPAGVPCGPVNDVAQVFADPHVRARGMRVEVEHPVGGPIPLIRSPVRLSETPIAYDRAPPLLGAHTREILGGLLGMDAAEIERLARERII
ncbi:MAG TPA: CaiB/BaiF CoA-transferase family protein [Candidatus Sulfotelmatobacter sp.]|nr:CaiB/BaiF CoA-transferase family protein [Candidatus Sulfotelmatobacter sp.]